MVAAFCCVPGCYNNSLRNSEMKFFKFPKGGKPRAVWTNAIRTYTKADSFQPEEFHSVCEAHFSDGQKTPENKMPTIFRVAKPRTSARHSFFGHKLRHNIAGLKAMKSRMVDHSVQESECAALNTSESDTEGSGNLRDVKPDILSKDSSDLQFEPSGLSQRLRKLSVGNVHKFLENWTPENSTRETRKLTRKIYNEAPKPRSRFHDENGILIKSRQDVCDCLEEGCPGCHFPCPRCTSSKCGHECRVNRRWVYDLLEIEGKEGIIKNKFKD